MKLDSCAAVSLAHSSFLKGITNVRYWKRNPVRLRGIGGTDSQVLDKAGYLQLHQCSVKPVSILCYVYDKPIADITAVCLIGMSDIARHRIDLNRHIDLTLEGIVSPLQFRKTIPRDALPVSTSPVLLTDQISLKQSTVADFDSRVTRQVYNAYRLAYESTQDQPNIIEDNFLYLIPHTDSATENDTILMTEIQLRQIVDRLSLEKKQESTDGQESMHKNGRTISKFCKEAMTIGEDVDKIRLLRVYDIFLSGAGDDSVFPTKNGCPKILTKYKYGPYSY